MTRTPLEFVAVDFVRDELFFPTVQCAVHGERCSVCSASSPLKRDYTGSDCCEVRPDEFLKLLTYTAQGVTHGAMSVDIKNLF